jgi:hypothetical protein
MNPRSTTPMQYTVNIRTFGAPGIIYSNQSTMLSFIFYLCLRIIDVNPAFPHYGKTERLAWPEWSRPRTHPPPRRHRPWQRPRQGTLRPFFQKSDQCTCTARTCPNEREGLSDKDTIQRAHTSTRSDTHHSALKSITTSLVLDVSKIALYSSMEEM